MTENYHVTPIDPEELRAARKAVARGVALLDTEGPADWRERIVAEQLDMGSTQRCVLGQTFAAAFRENDTGQSGYDYGVEFLSTTNAWRDAPNYSSEYFGFEQDVFDSTGEGAFNYPALGRAWEEVLFPELFDVTYETVEGLIGARFEKFRQELDNTLPDKIAEGLRSVLRSL